VATAPRKYAPRLPPEERREQVLDAALHLLVEGGYPSLSMEGVARAAGVTKPVVYDAFGDRTELLRALLDREERRALEQVTDVMPDLPVDADPDDLLHDGVLGFLRAVQRHPDTWRLLLLPAEGTPESVREHVDRTRQSVLRQLEALVTWGLDQRGGPADLDPELLAQSILTLSEQAARLLLMDPERYPPERHGTFVARLLAALERSA
jgi:AcrR family transcriptional regulator